MTEILWTPDPEKASDSLLARFMRGVGHELWDYRGLHAWSVTDPGEFWRALWDFADIPGEKGGIAFLPSESNWMTGARFFPEARLNFAEVMLRGAGGEVAVRTVNEAGTSQVRTRDFLRAEVGRVAEGLRQLGVQPGDRVAGVMPNTTDALVALLATASIGAIWTSCSPDFGTIAITDRLGQVGPKVLFASPRYAYGGTNHDVSQRLSEVAARIATIEALIVSGSVESLALARQVPVYRQNEFGRPSDPVYARLPFDHPLYILYTSGTTGAPKAIVHRAGGVTLQHLKEHLLHGDVRRGDALLWYTNTAWMMYHWMISVLGCGAQAVLYDGAPILKGPDGLDCSPLWKAAEKTSATHIGISPKYLSTLASENYFPGELNDLSRLRALMSAGAPVMPQQFDWVYEHIKRDMMFASISGGTEIIGCFMLGSPIHPVRRGQLTVPALGHAIAVIDERGAPILGRRGELVCTEPFPSMPITFWGEGGQERYLATYFNERPEIWTHGDVAELTATGGGYIHGRSDSTLKPGGVRIGTSEIYSVCETFPEIEDCVVFGAQHDGDEDVVLCIKLAKNAQVDRALAQEIRKAIREQISPRHVPRRIHVVSDVPQTINGKRVENAARTACAGGQVRNIGSLSNPECLAEYRELRLEDSL
jgi:acetoacetyl-CoA synthetase